MESREVPLQKKENIVIWKRRGQIHVFKRRSVVEQRN